MNLPENDYQILRLTDCFYTTYPNPPYIEILKKKNRAYTCLLFQSHYNYFICIPYRSEIIHEYAYHFKSSQRSARHKSGLDYSKIVIIVQKEYIDAKSTLIDGDEFRETMRNLERIKREALEYVESYVAHMNRENILHPAEFRRRFRYSPLKYFHKELGILIS